jgi:hypothetical protein
VTIWWGSPWVGKILTSDANGLASWSTGFSGTTSASGITGGTQNYLPKFGTWWNGLIVSQIFDNWRNVWIGTNSPRGILDVNPGTATTWSGKSVFISSQTGATGNNHAWSIFLNPWLKTWTGTAWVVAIGFTPNEVISQNWLWQDALYSKGYGYFLQWYIAWNNYGMNWGSSSTQLRWQWVSNTTDYIALRTNSIDRVYLNGSWNMWIWSSGSDITTRLTIDSWIADDSGLESCST